MTVTTGGIFAETWTDTVLFSWSQAESRPVNRNADTNNLVFMGDSFCIEIGRSLYQTVRRLRTLLSTIFVGLAWCVTGSAFIIAGPPNARVW